MKKRMKEILADLFIVLFFVLTFGSFFFGWSWFYATCFYGHRMF